MKKILIIGGTYFAGRVFAMIASQNGYSLSFINRGRYSMDFLGNVREYRCDRHDTDGLSALPFGEYDAVVDFCAYEPGDCASLIKALNMKASQYILLSTADVYSREIQGPKDESAPLQDHMGSCMAADYMWKKRNLETEAEQSCKELGIGLTVIRPAFIYGPFNYAPRESWFIEKIIKGQPILVPTDSDSEWNCVFVTDIARAICACIEKLDISAGQAYNLSGPEVITYKTFIETLREVSDRPFETYDVTVSEVLEKTSRSPSRLRHRRARDTSAKRSAGI